MAPSDREEVGVYVAVSDGDVVPTGEYEDIAVAIGELDPLSLSSNGATLAEAEPEASENPEAEALPEGEGDALPEAEAEGES